MNVKKCLATFTSRKSYLDESSDRLSSKKEESQTWLESDRSELRPF